MTSPVLVYAKRTTNADLIVDLARLGYLRKEWPTLDPTYGKGTFWKKWRPEVLVASDEDGSKSDQLTMVADFRDLPFRSRFFTSVVFDGPYKLNGRPDVKIDGRYGVDVRMTWRDRMQLNLDGISEAVRVLGDGYLVVKCQDQVCLGKKRWQTRVFAAHAEACGVGLVDRLEFPSYRPQPDDRPQVHAHQNYSTALVFKRGWDTTK